MTEKFASTSLLRYNHSVLDTYKLHQNVIIHVSPREKLYGFISGFTLNSVDELILEITVANYGGTTKMNIHPSNSVTTVQVI